MEAFWGCAFQGQCLTTGRRLAFSPIRTHGRFATDNLGKRRRGVRQPHNKNGHSPGLHGKRKPCRSLPFDLLGPLAENGELLHITGVAVLSATVAFAAGRCLPSQHQGAFDSSRDSSSSFLPDSRPNTQRQEGSPGELQTEASVATPVPSAEEVWASAWSSLQPSSQAEQSPSPPPINSPRAPPKSKSPKKSTLVSEQARLSVQGLNMQSRAQLLEASLAAIQHGSAMIEDGAKEQSQQEFSRRVAEMVLVCAEAVGKEWLGYMPSWGMDRMEVLDRLCSSAQSTSQRNDSRDSELGPLLAILKEKLPVHAVGLRYLRFGPDAPLTLPTTTQSSNQIQEPEIEQIQTANPSVDTKDGAVSHLPVQNSSIVDSKSVGLDKIGRNLGLSDRMGRQGGCLVAASGHIVQDLAVCVAEIVATVYLRDVRSAGGVKNDQDGLGLASADWPACLRPALCSTRSLERFRNQIFLSWWMHRHFHSVRAIFEDYVWLWGFHDGGKILRRKLSVRRGQELASLAGWRLFFSYMLEALDAAEPMVTTFFRKIGAFVSFLLVGLIGRALGLIFKGIRSSVGGNQHNNNEHSQSNTSWTL